MTRCALQVILVALILLTFCFSEQDAYASTVDNAKIILENYEVTEPIYGSSEFEFRFTLRNTSSLLAASNIIMKYTGEQSAFMPSQGSANVIYISSIAADGVYNGVIRLFANNALKANYYQLFFTFDYETEVRSDNRTESEISLYLSPSNPLSIDQLIVQETAYAGGKMLIGVHYTNASDSILRDVILRIDAEIPEDQKTMNIGSVHPGETNTVETAVTPLGSGAEGVSVQLSFIGALGTAMHSDEKFNAVTIMPNAIADLDESLIFIPQESDYGNALSLIACLLLLTGAVASYFITYRNRGVRGIW